MQVIIPAEKVSTTEDQQDEKASMIDELDSIASSGPSSPKEADRMVDLVQRLMLRGAGYKGKLSVTEALVGAFRGEDGQRLIDEIHDMTNAINDLDTSFERAYKLLLRTDGNKYEDSDGDMVGYAPRWHQYHEASITPSPLVGIPIDHFYVQAFRQLITESKNVASVGKCYAERYAQEVPQKLDKLRRILEDPRAETETLDETRKRANKTIQLLEASINVLLKDIDDTETKARKLVANLEELSRQIEILSQELRHNFNRLATGVDASITKSAEESVRRAQNKLDEIEQEIFACSTIAIAASTCVAGIGCFAGTTCASTVLPAHAISVAGVRHAQTSVNACISLVRLASAKKLTAPTRELSESEKELEDVSAIQEQVHTTATRLGIMVTIWSSIQFDATRLREWLKDCLNPDVPVESRQDVASYLSENRISSIYSILCQVLQTYATQVDVSAVNTLNT
ncbi:hypothetical protein EST38_g1792 [Candolleomyces aberdarensis]|uniref:Uncharacterized protein n=1 Tax=Candolleomyces aberdarensis TaxID=2316362 RepID=A0A4Q2DXR9_9AGAR|nr:hypothetical protein EST38_g1792 [Candolleomyces aberdarensis]